MTLTDWMMYNVIGLVFTPDEWHAFITGLLDGVSLKKESKRAKSVAEKGGLRPKRVGDGNKWVVMSDVKPWYYKAGYVTGEIGKVGAVYVLTSNMGVV